MTATAIRTAPNFNITIGQVKVGDRLTYTTPSHVHRTGVVTKVAGKTVTLGGVRAINMPYAPGETARLNINTWAARNVRSNALMQQPVTWIDADGLTQTACTDCGFAGFYLVRDRDFPHLCNDCVTHHR